MAKVSLNEAIRVSRKMANHFKAFEHLADIVKIVASSEQAVAEAKLTHEKLVKDIARLEAEREALIEATKSEHERLVQEQDKQVKTLHAQTANWKQKLTQLVKEYETKEQEFLKKATEDEKAHLVKIKALEKERQALEADVAELRKRKDAFKKSILEITEE